MEPKLPLTRIDMFVNLSYDLGELIQALEKMNESIYTMEEMLATRTCSLETCDDQYRKVNLLARDITLAADAYKISLFGWEHLVREHLAEARTGRELLNELSSSL